MLVQY